jgi:hypothetical protein
MDKHSASYSGRCRLSKSDPKPAVCLRVSPFFISSFRNSVGLVHQIASWLPVPYFSVIIVPTIRRRISLVWLTNRVVKSTTNKIAYHHDSLSLNQVNPLNIIAVYFLPPILILVSPYLAFPQIFFLLIHFSQTFTYVCRLSMRAVWLKSLRTGNVEILHW